MSVDILADVVEGQVRAILREQTIAGCPPFAAVANLETVERFPTTLRSKHPVNLEALGDGSFVQVCPTLGYRALWTHVSNDGYRESYMRFLGALSLPASSPELSSAYHVDHIFSRKRARAFDLNYIRMALIPRSINSSHGGGQEKARTNSGIGRPGSPRLIDTVMMMKMFGFRSPPRSGVVTPEIRAFAARFAAEVGATSTEIEREITELVEAAYFRPIEA